MSLFTVNSMAPTIASSMALSRGLCAPNIKNQLRLINVKLTESNNFRHISVSSYISDSVGTSNEVSNHNTELLGNVAREVTRSCDTLI